MSKFNDPNIRLDDLPTDEPPPSESYDGANDEISALSQQAKLNQERIKLFCWTVMGALIAFGVLILLFVFVVFMYVCMVHSMSEQKSIPDNFWHIPLMIAIMATSILYATLKSSAHFGENKSQNDKQNTDSLSVIGNLPIWQEIVDAIKSLKS